MLARLFRGGDAPSAVDARNATADELLAVLHAERSGAGTGRSFPVNSHNAMVHDAVYASVRSIANPIMVAPVATHTGDPLSTRATPSNQISTPPVIANPAADWEVEREGFMTFLVDSLLLWGNLFGEITNLNAGGFPAAIRPVHPGQVEWRRLPSGRVEWLLDGARVKRWPHGPLWHRALYPSGTPVGIPPIYWGAKQIGLGLAAEEAASDWFRHGSHPSGVLSSDKAFQNDQDRTAAVRAKERVQAAARNREVAVIGGGWKFEQIQIPPDQAQFLETMGANVAAVARLFQVDPRRIGASPQGGQSLTYSNLEMSELAHLTIAVNPVAHVVQAALSALLPRQQFVRLRLEDENVLGAMVEMKLIAEGYRSGAFNYGEGRARLGLDVPEGRDPDDHVWPPYQNSTLVASTVDEDGVVLDALTDDDDDDGRAVVDQVPTPGGANGNGHR